MPHSTRIKVRFGDCDPAGLVYYPVIFHYLHIAMEEFFAACLGVEYHRLMSEHRIAFPTVNVQAEFFQPILYGDDVNIETSVVNLGRSSLVLGYKLGRGQDGALYSTASLVHVAMNLDQRKAIDIPESYRRALMNTTG